MKKLVLLCAFLSRFVCPQSLDEIACRYGTDKSSGFRRVGGAPGHDYTKIYERYFEVLRNKPIKLLEIGFEFGLSAHMWDEYFSDADLHFIDYHEPFFRYAKSLSSRCHMYVADQSNVANLQKVIDKAGADFDIIIDDGSHMSAHQITSFEFLFPYLKNGGIYVIEDLHAAYWHEYGGLGSKDNPQIGTNSIMTFLFSLVHDINQIGARTGCASKKRCVDTILKNLNYYQRNIESVHFYDSLCFIIKQ